MSKVAYFSTQLKKILHVCSSLSVIRSKYLNLFDDIDEKNIKISTSKSNCRKSFFNISLIESLFLIVIAF